MADATSFAVYVVDDDRDFARSLTCLLQSNGFAARSFSSGAAFLNALEALSPGPIMLDIKMPSMDGVAVLNELKAANVDWPVVMMTGHGDIALAVRCIQQGAIEFIEKPFEEARLLDVLSEAMLLLEASVAEREKMSRREELLNSLSKREREVLGRLTHGRTNKQIAMEFDLSVRTVEMHRAKLMRRLGVRTTTEAIRLALMQPGSTG